MTRRTLLPLVLASLLSACASAPEPQRPPVQPPPAEPREVSVPTPEPRRPPSRRKLENQAFPSFLPIPVDGVGLSDIENSFNAPRSGGRRHNAIDIVAPRHAPVRATTAGYVSERDVKSLGGRTISVVGPAGYRHYYAHMEAWAGFDEGDFVRAGDIIGYVGNSGNARGGPTHLHYAIYDSRDRPIDPYPLLRRGSGSFE